MKKHQFLSLFVFALILHSCAEEGCIDINACNFSLDADVDDGSCYYAGDDCDDEDESTAYDVYSNNCQCEGFNPEIVGCTSDDACNYNAEATDDDGSCYYPGDPCDDGDSSTTNDAYNANCDCVGESTGSAGCTNSEACNYDPNATDDDGSCYYPGDPCDDGDSSTTNDAYNANCDCVGESTGSAGCTNSGACNYDPNATDDDGSCYYPGDPCDDGDSSTTNDAYNANCDCVGESTGSVGCTNSGACNYDPNATDDDGSCYYPGDPCDDGDSSTTNDAYNANCDCVGTPPTDSGCAVNADGNISVTFGVMTDQWSEECSYRIFWTGDETVTTGWIDATTDDAINSATWFLSPGYWTMEVNDDYGDGKTGNGFYFAECETTSGATEVLFSTAFTDGFESQTDFELTNGIIGPPFVEENN